MPAMPATAGLRRQAGREYRGVLHCAACMLREEGAVVFLRGWLPLFSRVAPLYVLYLPAYEQIRVRVFGLGYMS